MTFTKRLRVGMRRGEITCSVRIWTRPHVRVGARYRMEEGEIQVDSIQPIGFPDITPELARESGFLGVLDLLKVAEHGRGENIYLIRFHYVLPRAKRIGQSKSKAHDRVAGRLCGRPATRSREAGTDWPLPQPR